MSSRFQTLEPQKVLGTTAQYVCMAPFTRSTSTPKRLVFVVTVVFLSAHLFLRAHVVLIPHPNLSAPAATRTCTATSSNHTPTPASSPWFALFRGPFASLNELGLLIPLHAR